MDNKTKFFKSVVLLQFIPALLLGVLILLNFRNQNLLNIRGLHPNEFNYAFIVPLIFFGFAFLLSIFYFFSKQHESAEDESEILKIKRQANFWKYAFYSNIFFLIIIAAFFVEIFQDNPLIIDNQILFYGWVFSRGLFVPILSLISAWFLLTIRIYWKTDKMTAFILVVFGFFVIGISVIGEIASKDEFKILSEDYRNSKIGKGTSEGAVESEDTYNESQEAYDEEEKFKLISSWNNLISDWGGLEGKYDFQEVRRLIGLSLDNHITENDYYYLVQFIDNVRGQPEGIVYEFEHYKAVVYNIISPQTYQKANFDKIVDGLLLTYDDLGADSEKLGEIYKAMAISDEADKPAMKQFYSDFEKYFSSETIKQLKDYNMSNGSHFSESDIMWLYSFWARRNDEGNILKIVGILEEIKEHYESE